MNENDVPFPYFILRERKIGRNQYDLSGTRTAISPQPKAATPKAQVSESVAAPAMVAQVVPFQRKRAAGVTESLVPAKNGTFVPFGFYSDLKNILKSRIFYPIYITGHSGNGSQTALSTNPGNANSSIFGLANSGYGFTTAYAEDFTIEFAI